MTADVPVRIFDTTLRDGEQAPGASMNAAEKLRLAIQLEKLGVDHHFEEFDGTHSGMDWRLDISLPILAKALS